MEKQKSPILLILVLWAAGLGAAGQFAKISVIFPTIQAIYSNAGSSLGFIVSLISLLGILFGLFAGLFVARIGFRKMLLAALLLGALISAWQSTLPSLPLMLFSRVLEGVSHLIIVVAAPTLIARVSAPQHRTISMTLWSTFFGVSFAMVAWLGIPFVAKYGPGNLFLVHAGFMALTALFITRLLPKQKGGNTAQPLLNLSQITAMHLRIYRSPSESAPAFGWLFYTLTYVALLTLLPKFVAREHSAMVLSLMPLAGLASSITIGVLLLRVFPAVQVILLGFGLSIGVALLLLVFPNQPWLYIGLIGTLGLVQGASFAAVPQLNSSIESQAHANGVMAQMGNLGNTVGTPLLLVIAASLGYKGMIGFLVICYTLGALSHISQLRRRITAQPD